MIRVTLANRKFESVFQPIVELKSGGVVGAEALTRFEARPDCPPDMWFAEAREVGLGVELEMAALRSALSQLESPPHRLVPVSQCITRHDDVTGVPLACRRGAR